jgi:hypothetical protein
MDEIIQILAFTTAIVITSNVYNTKESISFSKRINNHYSNSTLNGDKPPTPTPPTNSASSKKSSASNPPINSISQQGVCKNLEHFISLASPKKESPASTPPTNSALNGDKPPTPTPPINPPKKEPSLTDQIINWFYNSIPDVFRQSTNILGYEINTIVLIIAITLILVIVLYSAFRYFYFLKKRMEGNHIEIYNFNKRIYIRRAFEPYFIFLLRCKLSDTFHSIINLFPGKKEKKLKKNIKYSKNKLCTVKIPRLGQNK